MAAAAMTTTHSGGDGEGPGLGADVVGGEQRQGDDRHRLLGVVGAVAEGDETAAEDLRGAEVLVGARRVDAAEDVEHACQEQVAEEEPGDRRGDQADDHRHDRSPLQRVHAVARDAHADERADQRVRRARGQAGAPGDEVPGDRRRQRGDDHRQRHAACRGDQAADGVGDLGVQDLDGHHRADEVEHGRQADRQAGAERARADGGGNRVGGVVEAVGEVEAQRHRDGDDQEDGLPVRHS